MSKKFEIQKELTVPVSVEDVWRAVATPEGQAGWSPDPYAISADHTIEENPPSRLLVRTPTEPNGSYHEFEYLIASPDTDTKLTFIHRGDLGDDWYADFDYAELTGYGWDMYLHTLKQYLTYFTGRSAVFVTAQAPEPANTHAAWIQLEQALGLTEGSSNLNVGDAVRLTPQGLPVIEGVVDYIQPGEDFLAVRAADGLYRFHSLERMGMPIAIGHYLYTDGDANTEVDRRDIEQAWQNWLTKLFA